MVFVDRMQFGNGEVFIIAMFSAAFARFGFRIRARSFRIGEFGNDTAKAIAASRHMKTGFGRPRIGFDMLPHDPETTAALLSMSHRKRARS